jgi:hypothetical protein
MDSAIISIPQNGMQSNGTGHASRQLQDKVGGVMPAGLFRLIKRRAELLAIVPFVTRSRLLATNVRFARHKQPFHNRSFREPPKMACAGSAIHPRS